MAHYKNPWHKPFHPEYGPPEYETSATPTEINGYLVYNRIPGTIGRGVWDVVRNGVCITQMAGPNGAKNYCLNN